MGYDPKLEDLTRKIAAEELVDKLFAEIFVRMIRQESGFRTEVANGKVRSPAGATGIAQLMPIHHQYVDPLDPEAALRYAARLFRQNITNFGGDPIKAAAAYNAGPLTVERATLAYGKNWMQGLPDETKIYLKSLGIARVPQPAPKTQQQEQKPPEQQEQQGQGQQPKTAGTTPTTASGPRALYQPSDTLQQSIEQIERQIAEIVGQIQRGEGDQALLTERLTQLSTALNQLRQVMPKTQPLSAVWDVLKEAFSGNLSLARFLYDVADGARQAYLANIQAAINMGRLDLDTASALLGAQEKQQLLQVAYAVDVLGAGKWISEEARRNAKMKLPPGTRYQVGFGPDSPLQASLARLGLPPMIIEVAHVDESELDPLANIQRAQQAFAALGVTQPRYDVDVMEHAAKRAAGRTAGLPLPGPTPMPEVPEPLDPWQILEITLGVGRPTKQTKTPTTAAVGGGGDIPSSSPFHTQPTPTPE